MKRFLFILALCLPFLAGAQESPSTIKDGKVVVERVCPFSIPKADASAAVNSFFVTKLVDSNETLKNASEDYYVAKVVTQTIGSHSMGQWTIRGEVTIEVRFKEDRLKVSLSCGNMINKSATNRKDYSPIEASPIAEKHNVMKTGVTKKAADEAFQNLILYMSDVIAEIEKAVNVAKVEDDW